MRGLFSRIGLVLTVTVWMSLAAAIGTLAGAPAESSAAEGALSSHPVVAGFERFYSGERADLVRGGRLLLGELNCTSCHQAEAALKASLLAKRAPILDRVGERVTVEHLRTFIADPHRVKPGTSMPELFVGLSAEEKKEQVEALSHLLASTGSVFHSLPDKGAAGRGDRLFHRVGCVACHGSPRTAAATLTTSVPLGDPAAKYSIRSLASFLRDPLKVRPSGRMPNLNLSDSEAHAIANYLLKDIEVEPNLKYRYFEGDWQKLPAFAAIKPKATGSAAGFDLSLARRKTNFGMQFEGFLHVEHDGDYTFHLGSDDGSKLLIDGKLVAVNDGLHPFSFQSGKTKLSAGAHRIVVDYFQAGGEWKLRTVFEGPGVPRQSVAGVVSLTGERNALGKRTFVVDPQLAAKGRLLFAAIGCAACHQLRQNGQPITSKLVAPPLRELDGSRGCVAASPTKGTAHFHLSQKQRAALEAAMSAPAGKPLGPDCVIAHTMTVMNCYACHSRKKVGGVEQARNALFQTTINEMGDEGRIPPPLDGVGDKLKTNWLRHVLINGDKDRPYMLTRMPRFGEANVGHLLRAFESTDKRPAAKKLELKLVPHRIKSKGRHLVGAKALSCIKCHNFGQHKATGIQATDLTRMTARLREDWFNRYMINPQEYRPGTRMPSAWPQGQSTVRDVFGGDPGKQLFAIWSYLSDGSNAAVPYGLIREAIELVPQKEPIVYRNFIQGLSPRGIAVGYPEGVNLAFDAQSCSLRLIWHGAFIDASKHWIGRGPGFQRPLGDHLMSLVDGPPLAELTNPSSGWPEKSEKEFGYRFRGYRLDKDRRPIFRYVWKSIQVDDFPQPIPAQPDASLLRTLTLTADSPIKNLFYRAAAAAKIESLDGGWYLLDGALKIHVTQGETSRPIEVKSDHKVELILPVIFKGTQARIVQKYVW